MKKMIFCVLLAALGAAPALLGNCTMKDCKCHTCNCESKKFDKNDMCKHKKCCHAKSMHDKKCGKCTKSGKKGNACGCNCDKKPEYQGYTQKARV